MRPSLWKSLKTKNEKALFIGLLLVGYTITVFAFSYFGRFDAAFSSMNPAYFMMMWLAFWLFQFQAFLFSTLIALPILKFTELDCTTIFRSTEISYSNLWRTCEPRLASLDPLFVTLMTVLYIVLANYFFIHWVYLLTRLVIFLVRVTQKGLKKI